MKAVGTPGLQAGQAINHGSSPGEVKRLISSTKCPNPAEHIKIKLSLYTPSRYTGRGSTTPLILISALRAGE